MAREVMLFYREFTSASPDQLTTHLAFATSPDGHPVVAFILCYSGPLEQGEEVIRPLREFGSPVAEMVGPMPYTAVQALGGPLYPPDRLNYWNSSLLKELSDDAIETLIAQFATVPFSPPALVWLIVYKQADNPGETGTGSQRIGNASHDTGTPLQRTW